MDTIKSLFIIFCIIILLFFIFIFIFAGTKSLKYRNCVPQVTLTSTEESAMYSKASSYNSDMKIPKGDYFLCLANLETTNRTNACEKYSSSIEVFPIGSTLTLTGNVQARKPLVRHFSFHAYNQFIFEGQVNDSKANTWIHNDTLAKFQSGTLKYVSNDKALKQLDYVERNYPSGTKLIFTGQTWTCPRPR